MSDFYISYKQVNRQAGPLSGQQWWNVIKNILRYVFWYFYTDIFLHFSYYSAMDNHPGVLLNLAAKDYRKYNVNVL